MQRPYLTDKGMVSLPQKPGNKICVPQEKSVPPLKMSEKERSEMETVCLFFGFSARCSIRAFAEVSCMAFRKQSRAESASANGNV